MDSLNMLSVLGLLAVVTLIGLLLVIAIWLLLRLRRANSTLHMDMQQLDKDGGPSGTPPCDPWIEAGQRYGDVDEG